MPPPARPILGSVSPADASRFLFLPCKPFLFLLLEKALGAEPGSWELGRRGPSYSFTLLHSNYLALCFPSVSLTLEETLSFNSKEK